MNDYTALDRYEQATQIIKTHIAINQTYLIDTLLKLEQAISWADIINLFDQDHQPQEIFEWWAISPWLAERLEIEHEPVLKTDFGYWWGRTTTGQAIKLDSVIQAIANN